MALTGDLQNIPIVDIIQLVHTTRKSGIFSVRSKKGESRIVFSGGYIVGANHVNDTVRIGSVLARSGAVTTDDLRQALDVMRNAAAQDRRPLLSTLLQKGMLQQDDARKALKTLVEMTIVELMNWTSGTFTFDTDASVFAPDDVGQDVVLDAQMVLMDALRIFDERERDRASGKEVPSFESLYPEVLPEERAVDTAGADAGPSAITADILGLADVDRLEKKIPRPASEMELFDPVEIHRQNIRELLPGFPAEEQEAFVAFLKKYAGRKTAPDAAARQAGKAVVLFSGDRLVRHSVMTICKEDRVPVFATDDEKELERLLSQCLSAMRMPVAVFDVPGAGPSGEQITALRHRVRRKYPAVPLLQFASLQDADFILRSYEDGAWAVLPKPLKEARKDTYVRDTVRFLTSFQTYIKGFQYRPDAADRSVKELKRDIRALREIATPSDAAMVMLAAVADTFERAVTFLVRPSELVGERSVGVNTEKSIGPVHADRLKVPLARSSVFRDVLEKGTAFYGESKDEALTGLFQEIGRPLSPLVILLPLISDRKVVAIVYGDFGKREASPPQLDILEILSYQVGMALEYALFRRQVAKAAQKA